MAVLAREAGKTLPDGLGEVREAADFCRYYAMLTRKEQSTGAVLGPNETIGIEDALRTYTINGAYLTYDEKIRGTLEVGKDADLAVFSGDPLDLMSRVEQVWVNGAQAYRYEG